MAEQRINLIDAVATKQTRVARTRSAIYRTGKVIAAPANNLVQVQLMDGAVNAGYHQHYIPVVGDVVSVLQDRGLNIVLGKIVGGVWIT